MSDNEPRTGPWTKAEHAETRARLDRVDSGEEDGIDVDGTVTRLTLANVRPGYSFTFDSGVRARLLDSNVTNGLMKVYPAEAEPFMVAASTVVTPDEGMPISPLAVLPAEPRGLFAIVREQGGSIMMNRVVFLGIVLQERQAPTLAKIVKAYTDETGRTGVVAGTPWVGVVLSRNPLPEPVRSFMRGRIFGAQSAQLVAILQAPEVLDLERPRRLAEKKWRNFVRWCDKHGVGLPFEAHLLVTTEDVAPPVDSLPIVSTSA